MKRLPIIEVRPRTTPTIKVKTGTIIERGKFYGDSHWKMVDKVQVGKRVFKKGQIVHWTDPDCGKDPNNPEAYCEWKFKIKGFMIYDRNHIDVYPENEMGKNFETGKWEKASGYLQKIPLEDLLIPRHHWEQRRLKYSFK